MKKNNTAVLKPTLLFVILHLLLMGGQPLAAQQKTDDCNCPAQTNAEVTLPFYVGSDWFYEFASGLKLTIPNFTFNFRTFLGPSLPAKKIFIIIIRIDQAGWLPPEGFSIGIVSAPLSDATHQVGQYSNEWGLFTGTGELFSFGSKSAYTTKLGLGDEVMMVLNRIDHTLDYYLKRSGQSDFSRVGTSVAFTNVWPASGRDLAVGVSGKCLVGCQMSFVFPPASAIEQVIGDISGFTAGADKSALMRSIRVFDESAEAASSLYLLAEYLRIRPLNAEPGDTLIGLRESADPGESGGFWRNGTDWYLFGSKYNVTQRMMPEGVADSLAQIVWSSSGGSTRPRQIELAKFVHYFGTGTEPPAVYRDTLTITPTPYLPRQLSGEGWEMIASPGGQSYRQALADDLMLQGIAGSAYPDAEANVYRWEAATGSWQVPSSVDDLMPAGVGHIVFVYEDEDFETGGIQGGFPKTLGFEKLTTGVTHSWNLVYDNTPGAVREWNLVGHPTYERLDFEHITTTNVGPAKYVWNRAAGNYAIYQKGGVFLNGGSRYIENHDAFWVLANGENPSMEMGLSAWSTSESPAKQTMEQPEPEVWRLVLSAGGYTDEMVLHTAEGEAEKLSALSPQSVAVGVVREDKVYAIARVAQQEAVELWPLAIESGGEAKLELTETPSLFTGRVFVEDLFTGERVDLSEEAAWVHGIQAKRVIGEQPVTMQSAVEPRYRLAIAHTSATSAEEMDAGLPERTYLEGAWPNPFNPTTTIGYSLSAPGMVILEVHELTGRKVAELVNGFKSAGSHRVRFDAAGLSSGMYLVRLQHESGAISMQKITLVK